MLRGLSAGFQLFISAPLFAPSPEARRTLGYHQEAIREMMLSQAFSEDSGYWDYGLLMFYDEFAHIFMVGGFTVLANFGWTERTAVLMGDVLSVWHTEKLYDICRNTFDTFTAFSQNFIIVASALWGIQYIDFWIIEFIKFVYELWVRF